MQDVGAQILGVVLNNVNLRSQDNYHYYQTYYHRNNYNVRATIKVKVSILTILTNMTDQEKVLVTGAGGFIGSHLVTYLKTRVIGFAVST